MSSLSSTALLCRLVLEECTIHVLFNHVGELPFATRVSAGGSRQTPSALARSSSRSPRRAFSQGACQRFRRRRVFFSRLMSRCVCVCLCIYTCGSAEIMLYHPRLLRSWRVRVTSSRNPGPPGVECPVRATVFPLSPSQLPKIGKPAQTMLLVPLSPPGPSLAAGPRSSAPGETPRCNAYSGLRGTRE